MIHLAAFAVKYCDISNFAKNGLCNDLANRIGNRRDEHTFL